MKDYFSVKKAEEHGDDESLQRHRTVTNIRPILLFRIRMTN